MAHFAQLDANNVVTQVIVVNNAELIDANGQESEAKGAAFCASLFGGQWVQTSYSAKFRGRFAGVGYLYDSRLDAFIPPKPFASWLLNEKTIEWQAPVPMPNDANAEIPARKYYWNESTQQWDIAPAIAIRKE